MVPTKDSSGGILQATVLDSWILGCELNIGILHV